MQHRHCERSEAIQTSAQTMQDWTASSLSLPAVTVWTGSLRRSASREDADIGDLRVLAPGIFPLRKT
jgi:hypothetical protein